VVGPRTPIVTARRTFDNRYSRIRTLSTGWIGITAAWHGQQYVNSMLRPGGSGHKNRRIVNPNIPTPGNPRPSGRGRCQT
jgi:hypothetical protein